VCLVIPVEPVKRAGIQRVPRQWVNPSRTRPVSVLPLRPRRTGSVLPVPPINPFLILIHFILPSKTGTGWSPKYHLRFRLNSQDGDTPPGGSTTLSPGSLLCIYNLGKIKQPPRTRKDNNRGRGRQEVAVLLTLGELGGA
jgi:hypothetical protein